MKIPVKQFLLLIFLLTGCFQASAQLPSINNFYIVPANPTPQDSIKVVASKTFSSSGCPLTSHQVNTPIDSVVVSTYHNPGFLPAICNTTDSLYFGPLAPGFYTLEYRITDASFTTVHDFDTLGFTVGCPQPVAAYSYNVSDTAIQLTGNAQFADSVLWQFGDGNTSTATSPTHQYLDTGHYQVCQVVYNTCGQDTLCQNVFVDCSNPQAGFSFSANNKELSFTNQSSGDTALTWYFDDGDSSTAQNPTHLFPDTGDYNVCLVSYNSCGPDTACQLITVNCPQPQSGFNVFKSNLEVSFFNTAQNADSLMWFFGDGDSVSTDNPVHTYADTGNYEACLITHSRCGIDTSCQMVTVTCPLPQSGFGYTKDTLEVSFFGTPQNHDSLRWLFGDGNSSTSTNPIHTYGDTGTYEACQVTYNACGTDTACQTVTITCPLPFLDFTFTTNLLELNLADQSLGVHGYLWTFGDGNQSTDPSPTHTYDTAGTYEVCLIAGNNCGTDTFCKPVQIDCPLPTAGFSFTVNQFNVSFQNNATGADSVHWDFGDAEQSETSNPTHEYDSEGNYQVCLTAFNACGQIQHCDTVEVKSSSVATLPGEKEVRVYPNPTSGKVVVEFSGQPEKTGRLQIQNVEGKVMNTVPVNGLQQEIDLSNFAPGRYLILLMTEHGSRPVTTVMKK